MKEAEIQKISIKQIFRRVGMALQEADVKMSIKRTNNKRYEELINKVDQEITGETRTKQYRDSIIAFLEKYEPYIDKTSLLLLMLENYVKTISQYKFNPNADKDSIDKITKYASIAKEMLDGVDRKLYRLAINSDRSVKIVTISSKDLCGEHKERSNLEKKEELEKNGVHLGEVLDSIILTDLGKLVCDFDLGELIGSQVLYNTALKKGIDPTKIDINGIPKEIEDGIKFSEMLPQTEEAIIQNIDNIDFDKLVLCASYRYIEFLEEKSDSESTEYTVEIIRRLKGMYNYLADKNVKIVGQIEVPQYDGFREECDYEQVSYKVKDLEKDMEKIIGSIYWGKAKVKEAQNSLWQGEIFLSDIPEGMVKLTAEEQKFLATINDKNYMYLLKNGKIKPEDIGIINSAKKEISRECLELLLKKEIIAPDDIVDLYVQKKTEKADITALNIDLSQALTAQRVYEEYAKEDNEEGQERIEDLYRSVILEGKSKEELEKEKQKIYDAYLQTMDSKYLELFVNMGTLEFSDLDGIMSGQEWVEALEKGEISEEFFTRLQEQNLISDEDIKQTSKNVDLQLKLWEKGKISSEKIKNLGISFEELMDRCDKGQIKGIRVGELLTKDELLKCARQVCSSFAYGRYNTIRPAISAYNAFIINRDKTIELIKAMKTPSAEIEHLLEEGLLGGEKIAELRYQRIITKGQFRTLKEKGLVTDEEEVRVANNLTPEEMLKELENNGCEKITNMQEILEGINLKIKREKSTNKPREKFEKRTLNPVGRDEILNLFGKDMVVSTPKDGFNGYQAYLIPKLGIAVLEKMFRKSKTGEPRLSYGDATYICEIGKYIQVSGQSKQEVKQFMNIEGSNNGNVRIINHTSGWGCNLLRAIQTVNPHISIDMAKDEVTSISKEGKPLDINIEELNRITRLMKKGEYSISLEEYEV